MLNAKSIKFIIVSYFVKDPSLSFPGGSKKYVYFIYTPLSRHGGANLAEKK